MTDGIEFKGKLFVLTMDNPTPDNYMIALEDRLKQLLLSDEETKVIALPAGVKLHVHYLE